MIGVLERMDCAASQRHPLVSKGVPGLLDSLLGATASTNPRSPRPGRSSLRQYGAGGR